MVLARARYQPKTTRSTVVSTGNGTSTFSSRIQRVTGEVAKRLVLNVQGPEKSGKDHFALNAPGPIAVLSMDEGLEGMVGKFVRAGKKIDKVEYKLEVQPGTAGASDVAAAAAPVWEQYKSDFMDAVSSSSYRTVIADTFTESYELVRLARFGKLDQIPPHMYGIPYAELRGLVRSGLHNKSNLILLHKMQDEWENVPGKDGKMKGRRTGNIERKGFKDVPFLVQANLETSYDGRDFHVTFVDCRMDMSLCGFDIPGEDEPNGEVTKFMRVAMMMIPDSEPSDWQD